MIYKAPEHTSIPSFTRCRRPQCDCDKNYDTDVMCRKCGLGIEPVNPWHFMHMFAFLLVAEALWGSRLTLLSLDSVHLTFLWAMVFCAIYLLRILSEAPLMRKVSVLLMIALPTVLLLPSTFFPYQTTAFTIALILIVGVFVGSYIYSCAAFKKANMVPPGKMLTIASLLFTVDIVLISFVFSLPLFTSYMMALNQHLHDTLPFDHSAALASFLWFAEISVWIRFTILAGYILALLVVSAAIDAIKTPADLTGVWAHITHTLRTFPLELQRNIAPMWQIFRYINVDMLTRPFLPIILFVALVGSVFAVVSISYAPTASSFYLLTWLLYIILLSVGISILIPAIVTTSSRYKRLVCIDNGRNILIANIDLVFVTIVLAGAASIILALAAFFMDKTGMSARMLPSIMSYESLLSDRPFIFLVVLIIVGLIMLVTSKERGKPGTVTRLRQRLRTPFKR